MSDKQPLLKTYQPKSLDVVVLRGKIYNPFLYPIYFRTQSLWTHTVVVRGASGRIYDAHIKGVEERALTDYKGRYGAILRRKDIDEIPADVRIKIISWADQLVKDENGYDFWALAGFLLGIKAFECEDKWFCSEVPYYMWQKFWKPMFNEEVTYVWPSDHYRSCVYDIVCEGTL